MFVPLLLFLPCYIEAKKCPVDYPQAMRKLSCVASVDKKNNMKGSCTVASKMRIFIQNGLMELSNVLCLPRPTMSVFVLPVRTYSRVSMT